MEDSYHSSRCKDVVSKGTTEEESGWTTYFEDLSNSKNVDQQSLCNSSFDSPSLVSDAASYSAWKVNRHVIGGSSQNSPIKKLTLRKTRARDISIDDSLEDTASSPVNSPKVADLRPIDRSTQRNADHHNHMDNYQENEGHSEYYYSQVQQERNIVDFNGKSDCIDLKKRGLCLVPMSVLVKYIG